MTSKHKKWEPGGAFIMLRLEVITSPAWRAAPRALKALLECLEIEHMRHAGLRNGSLFCAYSQFVQFGLNRGTVSTMSRIGDALGLLKVKRDTGTGGGEIRDACAYTLTYLPTGTGRNVAPTDDWKRIKTVEAAELIVKEARGTKTKRKTVPAQRAA